MHVHYDSPGHEVTERKLLDGRTRMDGVDTMHTGGFCDTWMGGGGAKSTLEHCGSNQCNNAITGTIITFYKLTQTYMDLLNRSIRRLTCRGSLSPWEE